MERKEVQRDRNSAPPPCRVRRLDAGVDTAQARQTSFSVLKLLRELCSTPRKSFQASDVRGEVLTARPVDERLQQLLERDAPIPDAPDHVVVSQRRQAEGDHQIVCRTGLADLLLEDIKVNLDPAHNRAGQLLDVWASHDGGGSLSACSQAAILDTFLHHQPSV